MRGPQKGRFDLADPAGIDAWIDVSRSFADGASGTVHAVIGETLPGNVWETVQLPALIRNRRIDGVVVVDAISGGERLIYQRPTGEHHASTAVETDLERARLWVEIGDRVAVVSGEAFLPGYGSPDFAASLRQVRWEDGAKPSAEELEHIAQVTRIAVEQRGMSIEITD